MGAGRWALGQGAQEARSDGTFARLSEFTCEPLLEANNILNDTV